MTQEPLEGFDKLYTTREVGALLNVADKTVCRWVRLGQLPAARVGRGYLVTQTALEKYIRERYGLEPE